MAVQYKKKGAKRLETRKLLGQIRIIQIIKVELEMIVTRKIIKRIIKRRVILAAV